MQELLATSARQVPQIPRSLLWHETKQTAKGSEEGSHLSQYLLENQQETSWIGNMILLNTITHIQK